LKLLDQVEKLPVIADSVEQLLIIKDQQELELDKNTITTPRVSLLKRGLSAPLITPLSREQYSSQFREISESHCG
jgi:hypothetical protein